jgi:CubicO group peptidase (beta-lactamase class C family)
MAAEDALHRIADASFRAVCAQVVGSMDRLGVPGVAVGVLHGDEEYIAGFGVTSVEHPLPVTEDTLFQIGSITKTFTATALFRLVELGKLALDVPLRTYLPDLRLKDEAVTAQVTLRHILTHTGGWQGDYYHEFGQGDDALAKLVGKMAELPQLSPLGAVWSYSNSGFYLAGRIIEVATGKNYEAALKELVLEPLGLTMSFFLAQDVITHRFAVGHELVDKQPKVVRPWAVPRAVAPVGGIVCNIKDLFRYARFHMGDGTAPDGARLLSQESLALMQTPLYPASGAEWIGLNWFITTVNGERIIRHGGGTNGQAAELKMVPAEKFAIAVLANSDTGPGLCGEISKAALKQFLGIALPEAVPLDLPEERLIPYIGRYDAPAIACEVTLRDGGLVLQVTYKGSSDEPDMPPPQSPPPLRVAIYDDDKIVVLDDPMKDARGEYLRNSDGRIAWLRFRLRVLARQA